MVCVCVCNNKEKEAMNLKEEGKYEKGWSEEGEII